MEAGKLRAAQPLQTAIPRRLGMAVLAAIAALICASAGVNAAPLRIVAIGASNTHGWYVGNKGAYPAKLQALLRAKGIDAQVTNAGVPFETTGMMLRRIDRDAPDRTDIVILEPGGNDRRFLVPPGWRAANIAEMERRLKARSISVIVYDEVMPLQYRAFYFIHSRSKDTPSPPPPCFRASWKPLIIDAGNGIEPNPTRNSGLFGQWTWSSIRPQCEGRRQHAEEFMGQVCRRFHFRR